MNKDYCILIDSATNITATSSNGYDIYSFPLSLTDEIGKIYDDGELKYDELAKLLLDKKLFKTSCSILGKLTVFLEDLAKKYNHIVFFPISYGISSQYQNALIIQEMLGKDKLSIIKTKSAACINHWIIDEFTNLLQNNYSLNEAIAKVELLYDFSFSVFTVDNPIGLAKGGRGGKKFFVNALKFIHAKPIIYFNIKNHLAGMALGFKKAAAKVINVVKKQFKNNIIKKDIWHIALIDGIMEQNKRDYFVDQMCSAFKLSKADIQIHPLPAIVLCHMLPGSFGIQIMSRVLPKPNKYNE